MERFKFRVFDKKQGNFLHAFHENVELVFSDDKCYFLNGNILDDNYVIQQFTGLKDKSGKEICEGDLVKGLFKDTDYMSWEMITSEVVWVDRVAGFNLSSELWDKTNIEVVGNIFEK
jgi:uncharacterized phage protein (TIGR01671 family)